MSADLLLTFNAGSSTVKISLFEATAAGGRRIARGVIDFRKTPLSFHVTKGPEAFEIDLKAKASEDLLEVLEETLGWLARHFDMSRVAGVGHRIVHGGDTFAGPVRVDDDSIEAIDALTILAPLHQPQSMRLVRAIQHLRPNSPRLPPLTQPFTAATVKSSDASPFRALCMIRASSAAGSTGCPTNT